MAVPAPRPSQFNHKYSGCSGIGDYEVLSKLGEGTFGEVHKAKSKASGTVVALKKILMHDEKNGFPVTAIREIKLLKMLSHTNILQLVEMAVERPKTKERKKAIMYMVTPYMEHDLSGLLTNPDVTFTEPQIKCYMQQLLEGLRYLHDSQILHRDMKAANLLISNKGILQIADFGLARHYDESPPSGPGRGYNDAKRDYTALVVTRWYRPPELLLGLRKYTPAIDLWGVGCVFGEMYKKVPILQGGSDLAQIQMIFDLVGSPTEENMPGWSSLPGCEGVNTFETSQPKLNQRFRELSPTACSLLSVLLTLNWRKRITAMSALQHPYFRSQPPPAKPHEIPHFEDSHELDHRKSRGQKGPPPAPAGGTVGMGAQGPGEWAGPTAGLQQNGSGPHYGSRPGSHDIRPRGPPPDRAYDSRRGPNPPPRKPGWAVSASEQNGDRSDRPPPAARGEKDTYIPSYAERPAAAPRDEKAREPPRRDYRDRDYDRRDRDRDYRHRDRDDRDRRDRDGRSSRDGREGRYRDGLDYEERPRYRESDERSYGDRSRRTTRSRSPDRSRRRERDNDPYARR